MKSGVMLQKSTSVKIMMMWMMMMTKGSSVPNSTDCLQILTFFHSVKRCTHSCSRRPRKPLAYNEKNPNKIFIDNKHVSTHLHHVQQIPYLVHSTFSKHFIWCTLRSTNTIFGAPYLFPVNAMPALVTMLSHITFPPQEHFSACVPKPEQTQIHGFNRPALAQGSNSFEKIFF